MVAPSTTVDYFTVAAIYTTAEQSQVPCSTPRRVEHQETWLVASFSISLAAPRLAGGDAQNRRALQLVMLEHCERPIGVLEFYRHRMRTNGNLARQIEELLSIGACRRLRCAVLS